MLPLVVRMSHRVGRLFGYVVWSSPRDGVPGRIGLSGSMLLMLLAAAAIAAAANYRPVHRSGQRRSSARRASAGACCPRRLRRWPADCRTAGQRPPAGPGPRHRPGRGGQGPRTGPSTRTVWPGHDRPLFRHAVALRRQPGQSGRRGRPRTDTDARRSCAHSVRTVSPRSGVMPSWRRRSSHGRRRSTSGHITCTTLRTTPCRTTPWSHRRGDCSGLAGHAGLAITTGCRVSARSCRPGGGSFRSSIKHPVLRS